MLNSIIRTLIIYLSLMIVIRLLGKRQIGQLQVSEFISTLLLSEIAAVPITESDCSLLTAAIPISIIFILEAGIPIILFRFPKIRRLIQGSPSYLIKFGKVDQKELKKNRISPEELLSILRTSGIADPSEIGYAVLEPSGTISVFSKIGQRAPTYDDMKKIRTPKESGIAHALIMQGEYNESALKGLKISKAEVDNYLKNKCIELSEVFLLTVDDSGKKYMIVREN